MKKQCMLAITLYLLISQAMAVTTVIHVGSSNPVFTIKLPSNATTGYRWIVGQHATVIRLLSARYAPSANTKLIGAPGSQVFQFKITFPRPCNYVAQMLHLDLIYQRPWESEAGVMHHYHIIFKCDHSRR